MIKFYFLTNLLWEKQKRTKHLNRSLRQLIKRSLTHHLLDSLYSFLGVAAMGNFISMTCQYKKFLKY